MLRERMADGVDGSRCGAAAPAFWVSSAASAVARLRPRARRRPHRQLKQRARAAAWAAALRVAPAAALGTPSLFDGRRAPRPPTTPDSCNTYTSEETPLQVSFSLVPISLPFPLWLMFFWVRGQSLWYPRS